VNKGIIEWPRWQPSREAKILGASDPAPISAAVLSTALSGQTIFSTLFSPAPRGWEENLLTQKDGSINKVAHFRVIPSY
jgi:hypothetical protein